MPWQIKKQGNEFCVVTKDGGKLVKCHPTREKAKSHLTALYVNEPSAAKKSIGYGLLKSLITERVAELKGCGANKPGGGGFSAGNTCARGGGSFHKGDMVTISNAKQYDALSKTDKVNGTVDFVFPGGKMVAVKVGTGQYNVDPKHLTLRKS